MAGSPLLAFDRARVFVAEQGSRFDLLFVETALGDRDVGGLAGALEAAQDERGAIRLPSERRASGAQADVESTAAALSHLEAVRRLDLPLVERAVAYLSAEQCDDGSWRPGEGASSEEVLALSGTVCGILAKAPCARDSVLRAASWFLESQWTAERVNVAAYDVLVSYLRVMTSYPTELADEVLQHCGRALERGYRTQSFDAVRTARVFARCEVQALPGSRIRAGEAVAALLAAQQEDGGWPGDAEADSRARIAATLEAVVALRWLSGNAG
jgi:hypothetical protein